jgi:hypothetical protein
VVGEICRPLTNSTTFPLELDRVERLGKAIEGHNAPEEPLGTSLNTSPIPSNRYFANDDTNEKRTIGRLWESRSSGKGLFIIVEKEIAGRDMRPDARQNWIDLLGL